jgi:hypothetical protein
MRRQGEFDVCAGSGATPQRQSRADALRALAHSSEAPMTLASRTQNGQRWNMVPGVFDAADLGYFAATVLACYVIDRWIVSLG